VIHEFNRIAVHLQNTRSDAKKLAFMDNTQLTSSSALALMNDLVVNATAAFVGEPDVATGTPSGGVNWVIERVRQMASTPILPVNTAS
jgi:hypothetical protein